MAEGNGPGGTAAIFGADPIAADPALEESVHEVMSHLLFHKSLIDEEDSGDRLHRYMEMVRGLQEGAHVAMEDPFEKSIAITLELVLIEHLDPWDVDLIGFSRLYLKRVKKEKDIDFITAGRLMLMAWSVLRLQTEEVLTTLARVQEEANGDLADWFEGAPEWAAYDEPDYEYTKEVLKAEGPLLEERVQRKAPRPVTLLELVDAFEEARRETELRKEIEEKRKAARERIIRERDVKVEDDAQRIAGGRHRGDLGPHPDPQRRPHSTGGPSQGRGRGLPHDLRGRPVPGPPRPHQALAAQVPLRRHTAPEGKGGRPGGGA